MERDDGARACVKRALSREELKYKGGTILENVETIVQWCNSTVGPGNKSNSMVYRYFWFIHEPNLKICKIVVHLQDQVRCIYFEVQM